MGALMDAARLGLEPGTEQYYLTPRKVKGRLEIQGIRGYQGEIELIYRAGAVSSVIVEVVYSNDKFRVRPGRDERPIHEIDWDADDRGELRLVYAYAVMKDGATSRSSSSTGATSPGEGQSVRAPTRSTPRGRTTRKPCG
jgi:recombination protein RecT